MQSTQLHPISGVRCRNIASTKDRHDKESRDHTKCFDESEGVETETKEQRKHTRYVAREQREVYTTSRMDAASLPTFKGLTSCIGILYWRLDVQ